jgi:hypothetical protein
MIPHLKGCSVQLEAAGASLLQRQSLSIFGQHLISVGQNMLSLSQQIQTLYDGNSESDNENNNANKFATEASQRCQYASSQMILAGMNLNPSEATHNTPTTGKSWLKRSN